MLPPPPSGTQTRAAGRHSFSSFCARIRAPSSCAPPVTDMTRNSRRTGGQVLIDALRIHGVDTVFCVPGESYLAALDALHDARDSIATITCRHEGGAREHGRSVRQAHRSAGYRHGHTRGPGACHATIGLHNAAQDSTPMVMFVGQVERGHSDREAFQEIRVPAVPGAAVQVGGADRRPGADSRAREPGLSSDMLRPTGARGRRAAGGHAGRGDRRRRCRPVHRGLAGRRARCDTGVARAAGGRPAARWPWSAAEAGRYRRARISHDSWRRTRSPPPRRFAARIVSTTPIPATRATSVSESIRSSPNGFATPTCCW